jgi:hypothetical protein
VLSDHVKQANSADLYNLRAKPFYLVFARKVAKTTIAYKVFIKIMTSRNIDNDMNRIAKNRKPGKIMNFELYKFCPAQSVDISKWAEKVNAPATHFM